MELSGTCTYVKQVHTKMISLTLDLMSGTFSNRSLHGGKNVINGDTKVHAY